MPAVVAAAVVDDHTRSLKKVSKCQAGILLRNCWGGLKDKGRDSSKGIAAYNPNPPPVAQSGTGCEKGDGQVMSGMYLW